MNQGKVLIYSHVAQKDCVSDIRINNPYFYFSELFPNVCYFQLPTIPTSKNELAVCDALIFHGKVHPLTLRWLEIIKDKNLLPSTKFIIDEDDLIWDDMVPDWNHCKTIFNGVTEEEKKGTEAFMRLVDKVTVSTDYLKDWIISKFGIPESKCIVVPNALPKPIWYRERMEKPKDRKPVILYSGTSTHFSQRERKLGDFSENAVEWIINSLKEDKIEYHCFDVLPWFLESVKEKVHLHKFTRYSSLPMVLHSIKPDFSFNPLYPCDFNRAKSDIKMVEASALNCVCMGSTFEGSPYKNCVLTFTEKTTPEEFDDMVFETMKEPNFTSALDAQSEWMEKEGRWLDSKIYVQRLTEVLGLKFMESIK